MNHIDEEKITMEHVKSLTKEELEDLWNEIKHIPIIDSKMPSAIVSKIISRRHNMK